MARPTEDPKRLVFTLRLAQRHADLLVTLAEAQDVSTSEALRRLLDAELKRRRPPSRMPREALGLVDEFVRRARPRERRKR